MDFWKYRGDPSHEDKAEPGSPPFLPHPRVSSQKKEREPVRGGITCVQFIFLSKSNQLYWDTIYITKHTDFKHTIFESWWMNTPTTILTTKIRSTSIIPKSSRCLPEVNKSLCKLQSLAATACFLSLEESFICSNVPYEQALCVRFFPLSGVKYLCPLMAGGLNMGHSSNICLTTYLSWALEWLLEDSFLLWKLLVPFFNLKAKSFPFLQMRQERGWAPCSTQASVFQNQRDF